MINVGDRWVLEDGAEYVITRPLNAEGKFEYYFKNPGREWTHGDNDLATWKPLVESGFITKEVEVSSLIDLYYESNPRNRTED